MCGKYFLSTDVCPTHLPQSARELSAVVWGQELAFVLKQCGEQLEDADGDRPLSKGDYRQLQSFGARVKQTLRTLWKDSTPDVFDAG